MANHWGLYCLGVAGSLLCKRPGVTWNHFRLFTRALLVTLPMQRYYHIGVNNAACIGSTVAAVVVINLAGDDNRHERNESSRGNRLHISFPWVEAHWHQPVTTRFSAILRYFLCFSMPMTFDAPKSRPAASMVPDPAKQSKSTPSCGSRYLHHQAATS